jgi:hypothetical protein
MLQQFSTNYLKQKSIESEQARRLRKSRNNYSSVNSGTPGHSFAREMITRSGNREGGALT